MNRVISDKTIVASIDGTSLQQVSDLMLDPPERDPYITLKTRVLERFADSDDKCLRKHLSEIANGDRKPFT